jgi:hypothetical protein
VPDSTAKHESLMPLYFVVAICFVPTLLALLSGVILLPHQIMLLIRGVEESAITVTYFVSAGFLIAGVLVLLARLRRRMKVNLVAVSLLVAGLPAIAFGPVGTFALMRYENVGVLALMAFVLMPLGGVAFLVWWASFRSEAVK